MNKERQAIINELIYCIINESIAKKKESESGSSSSSLSDEATALRPLPKDLISLFLKQQGERRRRV